MTSERSNLEDKIWEKRLEKIIEKKIRSCMKKKGLMDSTNVVIDPPLTKKTMAYPNINKLKPPPIDLHDRTKDLSQEG